MPDGDRIEIHVSNDGQVVLPKDLCERHGWTPGTVLMIEDGPKAVRVLQAKPFPPARPEDVFGMLKPFYDGPPMTLQQMDDAITEEVLARHARGRY